MPRSYLIYTLIAIGQARQIAVPSASALAIHTRTAQLQDKVEQQHLKRLVLNYEQREEAEELKGIFHLPILQKNSDVPLKPWRLVIVQVPSRYAMLDNLQRLPDFE